jgi:predicted RNA-binding Zn ribbon-like protein
MRVTITLGSPSLSRVAARRWHRAPRQWIVDYGDPSVDFVNTRWNRRRRTPVETLTRAEDVLEWLAIKGLVDDARHRGWSLRLQRSPALRARMLGTSLGLREALYTLFRALAEGDPPPRTAVRRLNRTLRGAGGDPVLTVTRGPVFSVGHRGQDTDPAALVAIIALAAARLLVDGSLDRLRPCLDKDCGVVFFDRTKNAGRRWCDMARCGAKAKMRRYRARRRL